MFTGIVEALGRIIKVTPEGENCHFTLHCPFVSELKIDQSIAHNGVCLTVVALTDDRYSVTAIKETLDTTNLNQLKVGDPVNLERCMKMNARLDGHLVQGHVDQIAECTRIEEVEGSWYFTFEYETAKAANAGYLTVEKGSVTVNGVSLTVVDSKANGFSVAIIPYTYEHTTFHHLKVGDTINLEFDIIGKYVARLQQPKA